MAFEPDIIVTGTESSEIALVAEVKTNLRDIETSKLHTIVELLNENRTLK